MAVVFLTDKTPDGSTMGQDATEKISFYGATPIVRPAAVADATDAASAITQVNALIAAIESLGLIDS
jgi:hypothetical protein